MDKLYLGYYIVDDESNINCMRERTLTWEKNIRKINKTAGKYPQESHVEVVRTIQSEWIFLQGLTWDMGYAFAGVEKMIGETFLPSLLFRKTKTILPIVLALSMMPINMAGLVILNPVTPSKENYLSSQWGSAKLIWSVAVGGAFSNSDRLRMLGEKRCNG